MFSEIDSEMSAPIQGCALYREIHNNVITILKGIKAGVVVKGVAPQSSDIICLFRHSGVPARKIRF